MLYKYLSLVNTGAKYEKRTGRVIIYWIIRLISQILLVDKN